MLSRRKRSSKGCKMTNPVLVEITRGEVVESRHRGAISVMDSAGNSVLDIGDTALPVFARSAIKAVQALHSDIPIAF